MSENEDLYPSSIRVHGYLGLVLRTEHRWVGVVRPWCRAVALFPTP
eukprot:COSAG01_NODE_69312_length_261_cov_1.907407_1_plen_45_part_10